MASDPMPNPSDFFTVKEAAHALDVHAETVRTAVKQGRLAGYRVFNKLLIKKADVESYSAATRPGGVKTAGRPRKVKQEGGENDSGEPDVQNQDIRADVTKRPFWVQSMNPETGNLIYVAAQPVGHSLPKIPQPKPPSIMPTVGHRIAERRRFLGLSQKELAEKVSISRQMLSHYEVGRVEINASDLYHVVKALDRPIAFFFGTDQEGAERLTKDEKETLENYRRLGIDRKFEVIHFLRELATSERARVIEALGLEEWDRANSEMEAGKIKTGTEKGI